MRPSYDGILFSIRFLKLTLRGRAFSDMGKYVFTVGCFIAIIFSSGLAKMAARMLLRYPKG